MLRFVPALVAWGVSAFVVWAQAPVPTAAPMQPAPTEVVPSPNKELPIPTGNAAVVNGQPIPEVCAFRGYRVVPEKEREKARTEILGFLIDNLLIEQYLVQAKVDVGEKEIIDQLNQFKEEMKKQNRDFHQVIGRLLLTEEELKQQIAAQLRWDKFVESQTTEKSLREFYDQNVEVFDGSMVHARHILLTPGTSAEKEKVRAELTVLKESIEAAVTAEVAKLPADSDALVREKVRIQKLDEIFATKAREKSSCPSKEGGGELPWFPRAGSMVEPFAKAAFAVKPHHMSDIIETPFGFHLILVMERRPGQQTKFEDLKAEVKEVFAGRLRETMVVQLRERSKIEVAPMPK